MLITKKKIKFYLIKFIIILLTILSIYYLYFSYIISFKSNNNYNFKKNYFKNSTNINFKNNKNRFKKISYNKYFYNSKKEAVKNSRRFVMKSIRGLLKYNFILKSYNKPKVSVIIPIRNRGKTIKRAIRSIQNQDMPEIEIILINDFSLDNTFNIIKDINKEDSRINVINNKKHMGTLYSRSIGVLLSNGKYVFPLDSDDMFLSEDVFNVVYEKAEENNYDIVSFKGIIVWNLTNFFINKELRDFRFHKKEIILHQPDLGDYAVGKLSLAGKCIKNKIYKNAIKAYGKKRYSKFITFLEDAIINYIICQFAKSKKYILKYGILIIRSKYSDSHSYNEVKRNIFRIKYIEVLFEFSRNSFRAKKACAFYIIALLKNKHLYKSLLDIKIRNFFFLLIKRVILSKYISKNHKKEIINYKKKIHNFF